MQLHTPQRWSPGVPASAGFCALVIAGVMAVAWPVGEPGAVNAPATAPAAEFIGFTGAFPGPDRAYLVGAALRAQGALKPGAVVLPDLHAVREDSWRHRLARRLGALPERWTSPGQLLSAGRAARDGKLAEHVSRQGHRLQNEIIVALLSAGSREALRASGGLVRELALSYNTGYGGSPDSAGVDMMLALLDTPRNAVYSQVGYLMQDEEHSLSTGLGYRVTTDGGKAMLGANAFYDYLSDPSTHRLSIGLEARFSLLDLYFNWYDRLSAPELNADGSSTYSPSGWDIAVAGRIPWVPWLSLNVERYRWNRLFGESDLRGLTYSAVLTPIPLTEISLSYDNSVGEGADLAAEGRLRYRFGVPLSQQIRPLRASSFAGRVVPESRRFERAQREYRHWVQTYVPCRYDLSVMGDDVDIYEGTSVLLVLRVTRNRAGCSDALSIAEPADSGTLAFVPPLGTLDLAFTNSALSVEQQLRATVPFFNADDSGDYDVELQLLVNGASQGLPVVLQVNAIDIDNPDATDPPVVQLGPVEVVRQFTLAALPERVMEDAAATDVVVTAGLATALDQDSGYRAGGGRIGESSIPIIR